MKTIQVNQAGHVQPYAQETLGGAIGLTTKDIAMSLGIAHHNVLAKLRQGKFHDAARFCGWNLTGVVFQSRNHSRKVGRPEQVIAMEVKAAKAFVAKWDNELGWGYLNFLLDRDEKMTVAESAIPKMIEEIADLRAKLESLCAPKRLRGPGRRHRVIAGFRSVKDLWGQVVKVPVFRELAFDEMTDDERRAYEAQHLSKISSGASAKVTKLLNHEAKPGKGSLHAAKLQIAAPANASTERDTQVRT